MRAAPSLTSTLTSASNEVYNFDEFLTDPQFARLVKTSTRTTETWRRNGNGPPFIRLGRRILYRRCDVEAWLATQRFHSRADELRIKTNKPSNLHPNKRASHKEDAQ